MPLNRSSIVRGPAAITIGATKVYSLGDVKIQWVHELFNVPGPLGGRGERRISSTKAIVRFTPAGHIAAATLAVLYPYASKKPGDSLFGAADVDVLVSPIAASKRSYTLKNGIVTKMPNLLLGATKTAFGEMEITCYGTSDTDPGTTGALYTVGTSSADTGYASSSVITQGYDATWGTSTASVIVTKTGWEISWDMKTDEIPGDFYGIADVLLGDQLIIPTAKCNPLYVTQSGSVVDIENLVLTELAMEQKIGVSINDAHGYDLTLANRSGGTTLSVVINEARLVEAQGDWGVGKDRFEELNFVGMEEQSSGALVAPWSITGA